LKNPVLNNSRKNQENLQEIKKKNFAACFLVNVRHNIFDIVEKNERIKKNLILIFRKIEKK